MKKINYLLLVLCLGVLLTGCGEEIDGSHHQDDHTIYSPQPNMGPQHPAAQNQQAYFDYVMQQIQISPNVHDCNYWVNIATRDLGVRWIQTPCMKFY